MPKRDYRKGGRRNWQVAYLDQTDDHWSPEIVEQLPDGARIITAYLYDPGVYTYCCSFEPTIYCVEICSFIHCSYEAWQSMPEDIREQLADDVELSPADWAGYYGAGSGLEADSVDTGQRVLRAGDDYNWDEAEEYALESRDWLENEYYRMREVAA